MAQLPQDNLAYPVLITIGKSKGSGFFYNTATAMYLVTAKHVLLESGLELFAQAASIHAISEDLQHKVIINLDCKALLAAGALKKHERADVAVVKIGVIGTDEKGGRLANFLQGVTNAGANHRLVGLADSNVNTFDQVYISNSVYLFGYPTSLGHAAQLDKSRPLLRRGIVAGKTEDRRIVLDCPVYFGNSGGLVVEIIDEGLNQNYRGIGIAVESVSFVEELWSSQFKQKTGLRFENSGYSLVEPIDRVRELL